jgi:hypothetical protein
LSEPDQRACESATTFTNGRGRLARVGWPVRSPPSSRPANW